MEYLQDLPVIESRRLPGQNHVLSVQAAQIASQVCPGQFVMAAEAFQDSLPSPLLKRALAVYSIGRDEAASVITLLVKVIGEGTRRLAGLQSGDRLSLIGPLGNGFDLEAARGKTSYLVAGGIGIASVYLLAETLVSRGERVHLFYGGRSAEELVGLEDFEKLGIEIVLSTDDGSRGSPGFVTEVLACQLERHPERPCVIYTCGPNPMMKKVTRMAREHNLPCFLSVESKMACGFGVCLGCSVKTVSSYRLACTHGPVFEAGEFIWEEE